MRAKPLIIAALTLLPFAAVAYSTPEEILFDAPATHYAAPPLHRETGDKIYEQMQRAKERREKEWAANYASQHPTSSSAASETSIEETEETGESEAVEETAKTNTSTIDDGDSLGGMTIANWEDPTRNQDVLHSGAPLTPTGLGTWFAGGVILATGLWTLRRAKPAQAQAR